jgi:hypothetical protein
MAGLPNNDDGLDVNGLFWLPSQPDNQVPGRLTFDPTDSGRLELTGGLGDPGFSTDPSAPSVDRILGRAAGTDYTLTGCFQLHTSSSVLDWTEQTIHVGQTIAGVAYEQPALTFDAVNFGLDNLIQWVDRSGMTEQFDDQRFSLVCERLPPLTTELPGLRLQLGQTSSMTGDGLTARTLTQDLRLHVELDEAQPLDEVIDLASDLQDLLSIATNQPAAFRSLKLSNQADSQELSSGGHVVPGRGSTPRGSRGPARAGHHRVHEEINDLRAWNERSTRDPCRAADRRRASVKRTSSPTGTTSCQFSVCGIRMSDSRLFVRKHFRLLRDCL